MPKSVEHRMTIYNRDDKRNSRSLEAVVEASGALVFVGLDVGDLPMQVFGDSDYEYWLTVRPKHVPLVLLNLIKERFPDMEQFREWADARGIPSEFFSYA